MFIAVWSSFFLEYWKRKQSDTAMRWGMVGFEETAEARSEFQGVYKPHPVTGDPYLHFPRFEFLKRVTQSTAIILFLIVVVIALVAAVFYFRRGAVLRYVFVSLIRFIYVLLLYAI